MAPHPCQAWCTQVALHHTGCPVTALSHCPMSLTAPCPMPWRYRHHTCLPSFPCHFGPAPGLVEHCTEQRRVAEPGCTMASAYSPPSPGTSSLLPNYGNSRTVSTSKHKEQIPVPVMQMANYWPCQKQCQGEDVRRMAARQPLRWRSVWKLNQHSPVSH